MKLRLSVDERNRQLAGRQLRLLQGQINYCLRHTTSPGLTAFLTFQMEIIRLVEQSSLSVRRTLAQLGIPRATFFGIHMTKGGRREKIRPVGKGWSDY